MSLVPMDITQRMNMYLGLIILKPERRHWLLAMLLFAAGPFAFGQLPFTEDFSDDNLEGVWGACSSSLPSSCNGNTPTGWYITGDASGLTNGNDYFYVYQWNGDYILTGRDMDGELCYNSGLITATNTTVNFSVDVFEQSGGCNDYIEVNLIVDGVTQQIDYVSGNFNSRTVTATNVAVTNNIEIQICARNNRNNEFHWFTDISLTSACGAVAITNCASNQTVNTSAGLCSGIVPDLTGSVTHSGSCLSPTVTQSPTAGTTFGSSDGDTQVVTFTVSDGSTSATCSSTLTLRDNQAPTITRCPPDQKLT